MSIFDIFKKIKNIIILTKTHNSEEYKFMVPDEYEEWYYNRPTAKEYLNNKKIWINLVDMIQYFKPKNVFEFSSGLGNVLVECSNRNINIIGSETSDYAIKNSLCKEKVTKIREIPKSKLPFNDNTFDLVFSSEVMEHVKEEYTQDVIKEIYRVCSKYALFTINTFDHDQPGHINMHPREWWIKEFENQGFKHNDEIWAYLNEMKYLDWDIFVFEKN